MFLFLPGRREGRWLGSERREKADLRASKYWLLVLFLTCGLQGKKYEKLWRVEDGGERDSWA